MQTVFVHEARATIAPGGDDGAPGAAITAALCGHWEHEPPCPLAPHHTSAERTGDVLHLRTLFVVEPELEDTVRQRIDSALAGERLIGRNDIVTTWRLRSSRPADVRPAERTHADSLLRG
ncbi:hypothetical protein ACFWN7_09570 [Agromyces sp. NPDC058484]|uniref:hypothetical protein n=1 Tax=Agromyces sp. NPDC058484 TaxID=3346524 RepID=UPI003667C707